MTSHTSPGWLQLCVWDILFLSQFWVELILLSIQIRPHFFSKMMSFCWQAFPDDIRIVIPKHLYGTVEASGCSILLSNITVPTHYFCCNIDLCFLYGQVVFTAMLPIIHSNFIFSKNSIVLVSTLIQIYQFDQESGSVIYCDRASIIEILRMLHNYKCSLVLFLFSKFYFS